MFDTPPLTPYGIDRLGHLLAMLPEGFSMRFEKDEHGWKFYYGEGKGSWIHPGRHDFTRGYLEALELIFESAIDEFLEKRKETVDHSGENNGS